MRLIAALLCSPLLALAAEPDGAKLVPLFTMMSQRIATPPLHLPQSFVESYDRPTAIGAYKVCLGQSGRVSRTAVETSVGRSYADDDVMKQLRDTWTYKPQPVPVCFVVRVQFNIRQGRPGRR